MMYGHGYNGILGLIILVLDIYAIIKIVQSSAEPIWKAIWIVVVLFLPVLGLILWWLLGPKG
ncbi:MAG: PLDc N-terminal domain-containing protein [Parvibaculum sp.]